MTGERYGIRGKRREEKLLIIIELRPCVNIEV